MFSKKSHKMRYFLYIVKIVSLATGNSQIIQKYILAYM